MPDEAWVEFDDDRRRGAIRARLRVTVALIVVFGTLSVFISKTGSTPFQDFGWIAVPIGFAGSSLLSVVVAAVVLWSSRPLAVDLRRGLIRSGRRTVPITAVDSARVEPLFRDDRDGLQITFRAGRGRRFAVLLRLRDTAVLDDQHRDALVALIRASSIERPTSPYDPTGRFARTNFPGTLDKHDAVELVRDPTVPLPG